MRIRPSGPEGVTRPFEPEPTHEPIEQIADALDQIAVTLAAIDHNVEVLANRMKDVSADMVDLTQTLMARQ